MPSERHEPEPTLDAYPPVAPGPGAIPWRCHCGNLLGIVYRRWLYTKYRDRRIEAGLPARVRCERCGRKTLHRPTTTAG